MSVTVKVTKVQAANLADLAYASESMAEAMDLGVTLTGLTLTVPEAAFDALGLAIGIRADIASEGEYGHAEARSWLNLSAKLAAAGVAKAAPLPD